MVEAHHAILGCRFVVDEVGFNFAGSELAQIEESLEALSDNLALSRSRNENVGIMSHYGVVECGPDIILSDLLSDTKLAHDVRLRTWGLLDKCTRLDETPDFYIDPRALVAGTEFESYGIAVAGTAYNHGRGVGVFGPRSVLSRGRNSVLCEAGDTVVYLIVAEADRAVFYRSLYATEGISEAAFFESAELAFPDLCFADRITFGGFEGSYESLRDAVVSHLAVLNDGVRDAARQTFGQPDQMSATLGIDLSLESVRTRSSEHLMRARDVEYRGTTIRCEWHTKLERHRNRIHFHLGNADTGGRVLIGLFVRHLPTEG